MDALAHADARIKTALDDVHKTFVVGQFQLNIWVLLKEFGEHRLQDHRG